MKQSKVNKTSSMFLRICIPLAALLILQTLILMCVVQFVAVDGLRDNMQAVVNGKVKYRGNEIQYNIVNRWTKLDLVVEQLNTLYGQYKNDGKNMLAHDNQASYLFDSYEMLVAALRQNSTNGIFLILNNSNDYTEYSLGTDRWGLGIRDYDSESGYVEKEDIVATRSPASIQSNLCSADAWWENKYTFNDSSYKSFFYPLKLAFDNPETDYRCLGYYSDPYVLGVNDSAHVVSYSVPLIYRGQPFGVLGIEVLTKYLALQLPKEELGDLSGVAYVFGKTLPDGNFSVIAKNGSYYTYAFGSNEVLTVDEKINDKVIGLKSMEGDSSVLGFISQLEVYEKNSPFEHEKPVIIGIISKDALYSSIHKFDMIFMISAILTFFAGLVGVLIISKVITNPVKKLSRQVEKNETDDYTALNKIGIKEIDGLVFSLESMHLRMEENLAKTEFFARMSHDMRTPMNAIIGFSDEGIIKASDRTQMEDYFAKINVSGKYLLTLINDVLDMSKISSGKLKIINEAVVYDSFLGSTLAIIEEIAEKKGVTFTVEGFTAEQRQLCLLMDKSRMQQIFINLLSNAVKFTPQGGHVSFSVQQTRRDEKSVEFQYKVTDNGCGMTKEFQEEMYKPFHQANPGEGTGLGLTISKNLVELLGGTIGCESEAEKGTVFTVRLCHTIVSLSQIQNTSMHTVGSTKALNGKRVLLCEDNKINAQIANLQLSRAGMLVECAEDGVIAVEKFKQSAIGYYDVVLMDIRMPNKNGLQATACIRALPRADAQTVPIIAMTANAFAEDIIASKQAGMNEHLAKPIDPVLLYKTLEEQIN